MPDFTHAEPGWYCFQALPKKEHIAAQLLRREGKVQSFCPRIAYIKNTRRGKVRFVESLFPGYLFLHTDLKEQYRRIRATQGIRDIVSFGDRLPIIPDSFIEELRERLHSGEEEIPTLSPPELKTGMQVTITEGPFRNLQAVISGQLDARQRVALLLDFLGRQMEVRLSSSDILVNEDQPKRKIWEERG